MSDDSSICAPLVVYIIAKVNNPLNCLFSLHFRKAQRLLAPENHLAARNGLIRSNMAVVLQKKRHFFLSLNKLIFVMCLRGSKQWALKM